MRLANSGTPSAPGNATSSSYCVCRGSLVLRPLRVVLDTKWRFVSVGVPIEFAARPAFCNARFLFLVWPTLSGFTPFSFSFSLRFSVAFHRFLIALSVLPGRSLASAAQLLPSRWCAPIRIWSSSSVQGSFDTAGFKWLCHLSRHCFEMRPGRLEAMYDHFLGPYLVTSSTSVRSSCGVHDPLTNLVLESMHQEPRSSFHTFLCVPEFWLGLGGLCRPDASINPSEPTDSMRLAKVGPPSAPGKAVSSSYCVCRGSLVLRPLRVVLDTKWRFVSLGVPIKFAARPAFCNARFLFLV